MNADTIKPVIKVKNLAEKAILVGINIGTFSVNKKDKKQSSETAADVGGSVDYIRVNKSLLKNKATAAVLSFSQKMRLDFYQKTAPWGSDGFRIVKIANYAKIKSELEDNVRKFYELVDLACAEYQEIINGDFEFERKSLGSMFSRADYPSISAFRSSFYARVNVKPVENSDFRTNNLSNEEIVEINNSIQERIEDAIKGAEMDVLHRINEKLVHLSSRLSDSDSKFHTSNITNLCETLQEAKQLNINDNEKLSEVISVIENNICGLDAENIRNSGRARNVAMEKTKESIKEISDTMADFSF
jgi:hypothetical protein